MRYWLYYLLSPRNVDANHYATFCIRNEMSVAEYITNARPNPPAFIDDCITAARLFTEGR